ncbi:hypothetical protein PPROV_000728300 [Pycnococcus provasolii]|uniref:Protein kinase domain-containing protein n=1 Tax=Pycnococcus provasolii TaxID=41880 RepID=A0A830HPE8_9CHLO|nr:hypothetical protein PPROV_000728300 [Pycnococcus provasolii]
MGIQGRRLRKLADQMMQQASPPNILGGNNSPRSGSGGGNQTGAVVVATTGVADAKQQKATSRRRRPVLDGITAAAGGSQNVVQPSQPKLAWAEKEVWNTTAARRAATKRTRLTRTKQPAEPHNSSDLAARESTTPVHFRGPCLTWKLMDVRTASASTVLGAPPGPTCRQPPPDTPAKCSWTLLGRGGYGRVYKVNEQAANEQGDVSDGQTFAVKTAIRDHAGAADALHREYMYLHCVVGALCGGHRCIAKTHGWLHRAASSAEENDKADAKEDGDAPASAAEEEEEAAAPPPPDDAAAVAGTSSKSADEDDVAVGWEYGIVLEHGSGGSLRDEHTVAALGPFDLLKCASDILHGLEFLHETAGLIHRDVKGRNVVLECAASATREPPSSLARVPIQAKLIDFGLACLYREPRPPAPSSARAELAGTGSKKSGLRSKAEERWCRKKVGTLRYRPPEMESKTSSFLATGALPSADVYSFGVTLRLLVKVWLKSRGVDVKVWAAQGGSARGGMLSAAEGAVASALVELASACMRTRAESRPTVRAARQEVERAFLAASAMTAATTRTDDTVRLESLVESVTVPALPAPKRRRVL